MADSGVYDRWHRARPRPGEKTCEHGQTATSEHGHGKRWQAPWRDNHGIQKKQNFERKTDAARLLTGVRADLARGTYIDYRAGRVTVQAYSEVRWLPAQLHLRPNSVELYSSRLRNHILPSLGGRYVGALGRIDMKRFVGALSQTLAPSTVHTVYAVLRTMMQSAVDDGLIPANPCSRVPLPQIARLVVRPLEPVAVSALAEQVPPRYAVTVWLGAGAGLREGEALGMIVPRVEFLARRLNVVEQLQSGNLVDLKTRASRRFVPVDDLVLNAVTAHMQRWAPGPHDLLVTNRCGRPVQRSSFGECWRQAVKRAGLPTGTRFHDLRHFYASTLIAAGLHPKTIQARLGHATMAETMDTYGHLFPGADDHGRGALDAAFRKNDVPGECPEGRAR